MGKSALSTSGSNLLKRPFTEHIFFGWMLAARFYADDEKVFEYTRDFRKVARIEEDDNSLDAMIKTFTRMRKQYNEYIPEEAVWKNSELDQIVFDMYIQELINKRGHLAPMLKK